MQASIYRIRPTFAEELTLEQIKNRIANAFKITEAGCWEWFRSINKDGYGQVGLWGRNGSNPKAGQYPAHRVVYELIFGRIPSDRQTDHLCGNIRCVNPKHLEIVDKDTNNIRGNSPSAIHARKTHCPKGHPYGARWSQGNGKFARECLECNRVKCREYYYRKKARLADATS